MTKQFKVQWIDRGRPPNNPPNPDFPNGQDIDSWARPACRVELPYMTQKNVGYWYVECLLCRTNVLITMASRPDDPKSVMLPCNTSMKGQKHD
jgi:hypothetical protein